MQDAEKEDAKNKTSRKQSENMTCWKIFQGRCVACNLESFSEATQYLYRRSFSSFYIQKNISYGRCHSCGLQRRKENLKAVPSSCFWAGLFCNFGHGGYSNYNIIRHAVGNGARTDPHQEKYHSCKRWEFWMQGVYKRSLGDVSQVSSQEGLRCCRRCSGGNSDWTHRFRALAGQPDLDGSSLSSKSVGR